MLDYRSVCVAHTPRIRQRRGRHLSTPDGQTIGPRRRHTRQKHRPGAVSEPESMCQKGGAKKTGCLISKTTARKKKGGFHRDILGNLADSGFFWWEARLRVANLDPKSHDAPPMDSNNFWFHFTTIAATGGVVGVDPTLIIPRMLILPYRLIYMLPPCSRRKRKILIRIIKLIPNKWRNPSPRISLSCHQTCFLTTVDFYGFLTSKNLGTSKKNTHKVAPQRRTPSPFPRSTRDQSFDTNAEALNQSAGTWQLLIVGQTVQTRPWDFNFQKDSRALIDKSPHESPTYRFFCLRKALRNN